MLFLSAVLKSCRTKNRMFVQTCLQFENKVYSHVEELFPRRVFYFAVSFLLSEQYMFRFFSLSEIFSFKFLVILVLFLHHQQKCNEQGFVLALTFLLYEVSSGAVVCMTTRKLASIMA